MAYFSNGTEGAIFQEENCQECVHEEACPVWHVHFLYNYSDNLETQKILEILIPKLKGTCFNGPCPMRTTKTQDPIPSPIRHGHPLEGGI